jgi:hypothetical protein
MTGLSVHCERTCLCTIAKTMLPNPGEVWDEASDAAQLMTCVGKLRHAHLAQLPWLKAKATEGLGGVTPRPLCGSGLQPSQHAPQRAWHPARPSPSACETPSSMGTYEVQCSAQSWAGDWLGWACLKAIKQGGGTQGPGICDQECPSTGRRPYQE